MRIGGSSAFRRGFVAGFTSPYSLLGCHRFRVTRRHRDTVAQAWSDIGKLLGEELEKEGRKVREQTPREERYVG